jgi:hypothetical protein
MELVKSIARAFGIEIRRIPPDGIDSVARINGLIGRVAELERQIVEGTGGGNGQPKLDGDVAALKTANHELAAQLAEELTFRRIRKQDAIEIESMLRMLALPKLPARNGREDALTNLLGTTVSEALYVVDALHRGLATPGAICEFGVAQGATSRLIAEEILATDRHFYLFDSFEGLPPPTEKDRLIDDIFNLGSMAAYTGTMRSPETEVLAKLDRVGFPRQRLHLMKGWVSDTLARPDAPKAVAFAYVDFDFYEPIRDALVYLDGVMQVGGSIVVDDYGFFSEGAQLATDEFVAANAPRWKLTKPLKSAGHFVVLDKVG